jgi:hypothetical protein
MQPDALANVSETNAPACEHGRQNKTLRIVGAGQKAASRFARPNDDHPDKDREILRQRCASSLRTEGSRGFHCCRRNAAIVDLLLSVAVGTGADARTTIADNRTNSPARLEALAKLADGRRHSRHHDPLRAGRHRGLDTRGGYARGLVLTTSYGRRDSLGLGWLIARMLANALLDRRLAQSVVGDAFDVLFRPI